MWSESDEDYETSVKRQRISPNRKFQSLQKRREKTNITALQSIITDQLSEPYHYKYKPHTFIEEKLIYWKEFCGTEHFRALSQTLRKHVVSLPNLLLSKKEIFTIIVEYLVPEAQLSLQAITDVLVGLARDLQDGFLEFIPELVTVVSGMCHGLVGSPEVCGYVMNSLAKIFKLLKKHLVPSIAQFITVTMKPFILHPLPFVQRLGCQSLTTILRQISSKKLKLVVKHILGSICQKKEVHKNIETGYACLMSHVCMGVQYTLHSKSHVLLNILFLTDLLHPSNFRIDSTPSVDTDSNHQWITEDFIQHRLLQLIKASFDEYLLKHLNLESSKHLIKWLIQILENKINELKAALEANTLYQGKKLLRDIACLSYIIAKLLSNFQSLLLENTELIVKCLQFLEDEAFLCALHSQKHDLLDVVGDDMSIAEMSVSSFPGQLCGLLVLSSSIVRENPFFKDSDAVAGTVRNLAVIFKYLLPLELIQIGQRAIQCGLYLPQLFHSLSELLCTDANNLSVDLQEAVLMLIWKLLELNEISEFNADLTFEDIQLLNWLQKMSYGWPLNVSSSCGDMIVVFRFGILTIQCIAQLTLAQPALAIYTCKRMMENLSKLQESETIISSEKQNLEKCKSAVEFQIRKVHIQAEMNQDSPSENVGRGSKLKIYLEEVLHEVKHSNINTPMLEEITWILDLMRTENVDIADFICNTKEAKMWITHFQACLKSPVKHMRCCVLKILSVFDSQFSEDFQLFSVLLEIEKANVSGVDRRVVRLIEQIKSQIEQNALHPALIIPCFYSLLGLSNIALQLIWESIVSSMSHLLQEYVAHLWPIFFEELKQCQSSVLTNVSTNKVEEASISHLTLFKSFDERHFLKNAVEHGTDDLTKLILFLQSIEGDCVSILTERCTEWIPLLLQWVEVRPCKERDQESSLSCFGDWVKVMKAWVAVILTLDSFDDVVCDKRALLECSISLLQVTDLQGMALDLLSKFNLAFLNPYMTHLEKLASEKCMKSEILAFPLDIDQGSIDIQHRSEVISILIRLLYPHIRNFKSKKQRGDPILTYLAQTESYELLDLLDLIFSPWDSVFIPSKHDQSMENSTCRYALFKHKWWINELENTSLSEWLDKINIEALGKTSTASLLQKIDLLLFNVGHKMTPYLSFLAALVGCAFASLSESCQTTDELVNDSLKLISTIFNRFTHNLDYVPLLNLLVPLLLKQTSSKSIPSCTRTSTLVTVTKSITLLPCFESLVGEKSMQISVLQNSFQSLMIQIFELLSNPDTSNECIGMILEIIEQWLDKEIYIDDQILQPILNGIQIQMFSKFKTWKNPQTKKEEIVRGLTILERIVDMNTNPTTLHILAAALTSAVHSKDPEHLTKVLDCLSAVWSKANVLSSKERTVIFSDDELQDFSCLLAKKASKIHAPEARLTLSQAFSTLSKLLPLLERSALLFESMVSFLPNQLEGVDYERRLKAFESLTVDFWTKEQDQHYEILIHTCFFDLQNDMDFSLRQASSAALLRLISVPSISTRILKLLFNQLCKKTGSSNLAVRQEQLIILSKIIEIDNGVLFPWASIFHDSDPDLNFLKNIAHFQVSRRIKAWQKISKKLSNKDTFLLTNGEEMDVTLVVLRSSKLLLPLLFQVIFDGQSAERKSKGRATAKVNEGKESSLVEICVKVLSQMSYLMPWVPYRKLLNKTMSKVRATEQPSKGMIRTLCTIVDSFHFDLPVSIPNSDEEEMVSILTKKVFPLLDSLLFSRSQEKASLPVAVSLAKLHCKLQGAIPSDLSGFLTKLANLLLHRIQHIRDEARDVFVSVATALGCKHLYTCLRALISVLPMKGYTAHVLDYTLNSVLEKISQVDSEATEIDRILEIVLPVLSDCLFGASADARSAKQFSAKYKESKSTKAPDILQLLYKLCTLSVSSPVLLKFVQEKFSLCGSSKHLKVVESLLENAIHGFVQNETATFSGKLIIIKDLIISQTKQTTLPSCKATQSATLEDLENVVYHQKQDSIAKYDYLLKEFGLKLFRKCIKTYSSSTLPLEEIDCFIPLLSECLRSSQGNISNLALKSLCLLVTYPLHSFQEHATEIGQAVIRLLDSAPNMNTDNIAQDCLKLLARMLTAGDWFNPTDMQVNSLLTVIDADFEEQSSDLQASFKLLQAIINRKIVVPKVYDVMIKVREILIQSQSSQMREMAASIFLQILLKFPLASKQVEKHLLFILGNLNYEYETGRLQALELLNQVILKFPIELLVEKCPLFYMPLVKRLGDESTVSCKNEVVKVIKLLVNKMDPKVHDTLIKMNLTWMKNTSEILQIVGFQAMAIFMETIPQCCLPYEDDLYQIFIETLSKEVENDEWKQLYLVLSLMEKICVNNKLDESYQSLLNESVLKCGKLWIRVVEMLEFPHAWIRASASRLVGHAFVYLEQNLDIFLQSKEETVILGEKTAAKLAFGLYVMLESDTMEEKAIKQCSKNLVWLSPILNIQSSIAPRRNETQHSVIREKNKQKGTGLSLMGVISRMVKLADLRAENKTVIRISAFKFLGALAIRLNSHNCLNSYLSLMLQPIYRIIENKDLRATEGEANNIAQEVLEHIRTLVDGNIFREAYFKARTSVEEVRNKRKTKESLQKVLNPQSQAKRKLKQHRKKAEIKRQRKQI